MFDPKSDYALNKLDPEAIVCPSATGIHIRLTREDFASDEEFRFWKDFSDDDYRDIENAGRSYRNNCVPLTDSLESSAPSAEEILIAPLLEIERTEQRMTLLQKVKTALTEKQYRRLWLLYVENKRVAEIASLEGVSQRAVYSSIEKAQAVIVNIV